MSKIVGMRVDKPRAGAPEFVKGRVGINVAQFGQWMMQNADDRGWVNLDLLLSKEGDLYMKHNEFKPGTALRSDDPKNAPSHDAWTGEPTKSYPRAKADAPDDMNDDSIPF